MHTNYSPYLNVTSIGKKDLSFNCLESIETEMSNIPETVGYEVASTIISAGKERTYSLETCPIIRRRLQTKLLGKIRSLLDEYSIRIGQHACAIFYSPKQLKNKESIRVYGSRPMEDVLRNLRDTIVCQLEKLIIQKCHTLEKSEKGYIIDLPRLACDGIPTTLDAMTQAQLRAFVPYLLKAVSGRGKPMWGRKDTQPTWWPKDVPWANVRADMRSESLKQKVSWTDTLRQIIRNCYVYYGREELLGEFVNPTKTEEKLSIKKEKINSEVIQTMNDNTQTGSTTEMIRTTTCLNIGDPYEIISNNNLTNNILSNLNTPNADAMNKNIHNQVSNNILLQKDTPCFDSNPHCGTNSNNVKSLSRVDHVVKSVNDLHKHGNKSKKGLNSKPINLQSTRAIDKQPLITMQLKPLQNLDGTITLIPIENRTDILNNDVFSNDLTLLEHGSVSNSITLNLSSDTNNTIGTIYTLVVGEDGQSYLKPCTDDD